MEVLTAIIGMLGGLAMFLYGIEIMGDGLKNSSGDALKRVLVISISTETSFCYVFDFSVCCVGNCAKEHIL